MPLGRAPEIVENRSRLHAGEPPRRIEVEDAVHVLREVEHYCHVAALPGQAGAAAPAENRRAVRPAHFDGRRDVVRVAGKDDADWRLTVNGAVGRVASAAAAVESDLAAHYAGE